MGAGLKTEKLKKVNDDQWDELLKGIDKNGDGKIDFEEFQEHMMLLIPKGHYGPRATQQLSAETASTELTSQAQTSTQQSTMNSTAMSGMSKMGIVSETQ